MDLIVNGTTNGFWRVDNLEEARVGLDFLAHPFALFRDEAVAARFCLLFNPAAATAIEGAVVGQRPVAGELEAGL